MSKHRLNWVRYHDILLLACVTWLVLALIRRTRLPIILAGVAMLSFYSQVLRQYGVLDASASESLRRPWSTRLCLLLSAHQPLNFVANAAATAFVAMTLVETFNLSWLFWLLSPVGIYTGYFLVGPGILSIMKWPLVGTTRIVVFRRFSAATAAHHRSTILPILGAYGYLILYSDRSLEDAEAGPIWETQELLGGLWYHMPPGESDWADRILFELSRAEFAVFDWEGAPIPNMELEFRLASRALPGKRLIVALPGRLCEATRRAFSLEHAEHPSVLSRDASYWSHAKGGATGDRRNRVAIPKARAAVVCERVPFISAAPRALQRARTGTVAAVYFPAGPGGCGRGRAAFTLAPDTQRGERLVVEAELVDVAEGTRLSGEQYDTLCGTSPPWRRTSAARSHGASA